MLKLRFFEEDRPITLGSAYKEEKASNYVPIALYTGSPRALSAKTKSVSGENIDNYLQLLEENRILPMTRYVKYELDWACSGNYRAVQTLVPSGTNSYYSFPTDTHKYPTDGYEQFLSLGSVEMQRLALEYDVVPYVQAALAKIYSSGWDALTFTAELTKTVAFFKVVVMRFWEVMKHVLQAAKTGLFGLVADFNKLWLQYRFALRPVYYDVIDIMNTLDKLDCTRKRFRDRAGHEILERETIVNTLLNYQDSVGTLAMDSVRDIEFRVGLRGLVVADMDPPKVRLNPVTTAWELVKFSWFVDRFVQIGTWLEALSGLVLAKEYQAAGSYQLVRETTVSSAQRNSGKWSGSCDMGGYCREVLTLRVPQKVSKLPQSVLRLDVEAIMDVLALLKQALNR